MALVGPSPTRHGTGGSSSLIGFCLTALGSYVQLKLLTFGELRQTSTPVCRLLPSVVLRNLKKHGSFSLSHRARITVGESFLDYCLLNPGLNSSPSASIGLFSDFSQNSTDTDLAQTFWQQPPLIGFIFYGFYLSTHIQLPPVHNEQQWVKSAYPSFWALVHSSVLWSRMQPAGLSRSLPFRILRFSKPLLGRHFISAIHASGLFAHPFLAFSALELSFLPK